MRFGSYFLFMAMLFGVMVYAVYSLSMSNEQSYRVEFVRDTEIKCSGNEDGITCKYLAYTDQGVFENSDSVFHGKFNSADYSLLMTEGNTCSIKTYGYRFPFFSMFQNIVDINNCVEKDGNPISKEFVKSVK